ncbi:MAG: acyltransferase family protein [Oscillospiraceae bacterium]|nr:acyltransferase family protein [Oscillospiraceae bacterium]
MAETKKRLVWLDLMKSFLIVLVVLGHSLQTIGVERFFGGAVLWYGIYTFHMAAFFSVSGYLFFSQFPQGAFDWKWLFRREINLAVPVAFFVPLYVALRCAFGMDGSWIRSFIVSLNHFWFVGILMVIELIAFLICGRKSKYTPRGGVCTANTFIPLAWTKLFESCSWSVLRVSSGFLFSGNRFLDEKGRLADAMAFIRRPIGSGKPDLCPVGAGFDPKRLCQRAFGDPGFFLADAVFFTLV